MKFAVIGVAGYIAPRHLRAISEIGAKTVAAVDPWDSVGRLDSFGFDIRYGKQVSMLDDIDFDWLTVCSPNYLHSEHCLYGLKHGANVICEKPLVLHQRDLEALSRAEQNSGRRIYTILQLRLHPAVTALKLDPGLHYQVSVDYHTPRGYWYEQSWKCDLDKSGGLFFNIGVHLFDLLLWLFGSVKDSYISERSLATARGTLDLDRATVNWSLSTDPALKRRRSLLIDGVALDLTGGFDNLHTEIYRQTLAGNGYGIEDARGAIELCHLLSRT